MNIPSAQLFVGNYDLIDKESSFDIRAYLRKISKQHDAMASSRGEVNDQVFKNQTLNSSFIYSTKI